MYKSYKNLKNGKIRLGRGSSVSSSHIQTHRSQSKKLSEGSVSNKYSFRSSASANKPKAVKRRIKLADSKTKSLVSENDLDQYEADFDNSVHTSVKERPVGIYT